MHPKAAGNFKITSWKKVIKIKKKEKIMGDVQLPESCKGVKNSEKLCGNDC